MPHSTHTIFDLAIIGGGPAGVAAGVYAARKKMRTVFITASFESQSTVSDDIQNWIGTPHIAGADLTKALEAHLRAYAADVVDIRLGERARRLAKDGDAFLVETEAGAYRAKTILIVTGSSRTKLAVPGAERFDNKGISYCATCDAPLFAGLDVAVVGGGNAGFESAIQLAAHAKSVTLIARSGAKADQVTVERFAKLPHARIIEHADVIAVTGDAFVTGLSYRDRKTGAEAALPVAGIFVEIGAAPATAFAKDLVALNAGGEIIVDPKTQAASAKGVWAAGDCADGLYKQNNIAAGDAVKALEDIYLYLKAK